MSSQESNGGIVLASSGGIVPEELWGRYQEQRRLSERDHDIIADLQRRLARAEVALENLRGDVYLYGIGEITKDQLLGLVEGT